MGVAIGIFFAVFALLVYIIFLCFFCGGVGMALLVVPVLILLLVFYLKKISTPSSYPKLAKQVLAEASRKDAKAVEEKRNAIQKRVEDATEENNKKIRRLEIQLEQVNQRLADNKIIPEYYTGITDVIEAYLRTGRAESVKQAINLYEKEKLTAEVIDAEYRASQATPVDEMKKQAFLNAEAANRDAKYAHEVSMYEKEKRNQRLQAENEILRDELERGQKINKYPQEGEL